MSHPSHLQFTPSSMADPKHDPSSTSSFSAYNDPSPMRKVGEGDVSGEAESSDSRVIAHVDMDCFYDQGFLHFF